LEESMRGKLNPFDSVQNVSGKYSRVRVNEDAIFRSTELSVAALTFTRISPGARFGYSSCPDDRDSRKSTCLLVG